MRILEKIINDLKSKIPFLQKKGEISDDESQEEGNDSVGQEDKTGSTDISEISSAEISEDELLEEAPKSPILKLQEKLNSLLKKKSGSSSQEVDDEKKEHPGKDDKKKKRSKIIQIVIAAGLVIFLASDYIFPPDDGVTTDGPPALKPRPKPVKKVESSVRPGVDEAEAPPASVVDSSIEQSNTDTKNPGQASDDLSAAAVKSTEDSIGDEAPAKEAAEASSNVDATSVEGPNVDESVETPPVDAPVAIPVDTVIPVETKSDEAPIIETDIEDLGPKTDLNSATTAIGDENDLTEKILEDLEKQTSKKPITEVKKEYVPPPDYEYVGRGLVYNCAGKHWACVDGPSYKACEENASSVKYLKRRQECHPFNVYETVKGCEGMQYRMVSSGAKTDFCNE